MTSVAARLEPITMNELYTQLVSFEQHVEACSGGTYSSANKATRGGCGGNYYNKARSGGCRGRARSGHGPKGGRSGGRFLEGLFCLWQGGTPCLALLQKVWWIFFMSSTENTSAATSSYGVDTNWYMDTAATDHIIGELEKLTVHDKYHGREQVHAANGTGMRLLMLVTVIYIHQISIFEISFIYHKHIKSLFYKLTCSW